MCQLLCEIQNDPPETEFRRSAETAAGSLERQKRDPVPKLPIREFGTSAN